MVKDMDGVDYRQVAKELGIRFRIGKYGVQFGRPVVPTPIKRPLLPRLRIIPLDGWITDPKEVERIMRERGLEL